MSGHDPLITAAMNVPSGYNLAQIPSMPLLGVLALPLTVLAGPLVSAKVFVIAAMPLSATSAFLVLRRWGVWDPAAALGGLVYGYSPYMVDQGATHLHLVFVPLPPLIVSLVARTALSPDVGRRRRWARLGSLAALMVAQYLIAAEILAMTMVICLAGLTLAVVHSVVREGAGRIILLRSSAADLLAASLLACAVLADPLWLQFFGPQHYTGPAWPAGNRWYADGFAFFAPGPWQALGPVLRRQGQQLSAFTGDETDAYLGFGVAAVTIAVAWLARQAAGVRLASALAVLSVVLSLGPTLVIDGRTNGFPMPFRVIDHVPGLDSILPIRFAFATCASVAAVLAFGLSYLHCRRDLEQGRGRRRVLTAVPLAVAGIFVVTWLPSWPYPASRPATPSQDLIQSVPEGDPITLTYPYVIDPEDRALLWQAVGNFDFRILGGYAYRPASSGRATLLPPLLDPPGVEEYLAEEFFGPNQLVPAPPSAPIVEAETTTFLRLHHVSAVLVDLSATHGTQVERFFASILGVPSARSGSFILWDTANLA